MNISIIRYILGSVLKFEAALMLLPCLVAVIYRESSGFSFVITILLCLAFGFLLSHRRPSSTVFYMKEGFLSVSLSWILLSIFGALPFLISGEIPAVEDALFEAVSGFTTTGSSILTDVEALTHCILFWRSFTHWIGGMGVLVFILAILPMKGGSVMNLMKAESPGPSVSKFVPRVRGTAKILYQIYIVMTIVLILSLLLSGMTLFESLTLSFGAAGTGGFSILNSGCGTYTPVQQWILTIGMILFGVNFNFYYLILCRKFKAAALSQEVRAYFLVILAAIAAITVDIQGVYDTLGETVRHAAFQVGSIITTTGYATTDFNLWPEFSKTILLLLMFIGACAGSTGGGIKVSRVLILLKTVKKEMMSIVHPRSVKQIHFDKRPVEHEVLRSINVFLTVYMTIFAFSLLVISMDEFSLETNFSAVATTFNNIGPGMDKVGPMGNFSEYSPLSKLVLTFDMLAGRLELFPMLILFSPSTWRKRH